MGRKQNGRKETVEGKGKFEKGAFEVNILAGIGDPEWPGPRVLSLKRLGEEFLKRRKGPSKRNASREKIEGRARGGWRFRNKSASPIRGGPKDRTWWKGFNGGMDGGGGV